jgi:hypothetical protein
MALTLIFDPAIRLVLEPGYRQTFSADRVARRSQPADTRSGRQLWHIAGMGAIMLKPLQLSPEFLNHAAQLTSNCVARLSTDYMVNPADIAAQTIFEAAVGTTDNPWIFHAPATPMTLGPTLPPVGPMPFHSLQDIGNASESGSDAVFSANPGAEPTVSPLTGRPTDIHLGPDSPSKCRMLVNTPRFRANQGFFFRWHFPDPKLTPHQTIYGFAWAQYFFYCRETLLEVYRDVSAGGDRSAWNREYSIQNFFNSSGATPSSVNPNWPFGQQTIGDSPGEDRSVLVIPYHRNRILLLSNNGATAFLTVRDDPQLLPDGSDYDITRSDSVEVWALTGVPGRFQVQIVKYESGPAVLNLPPAVTEYTPLTTPLLIPASDVFYDEQLLAAITTPPTYTFPVSPISNDTPPPTADGTGMSRTYGMTLTFSSSSGQSFSPQYYGMEVVAKPIFMDNPATPHTVQDISGDSLITSAEVSMGLLPGEGHMTARVLDIGPSYPLAAYYDRSEMPLQLQLNGTPLFTGYSDRSEIRPLRKTGAPVEMTVRARDRWLLLETSYLRDQRDYSGVGQITVVNFIAQQCGIDTGWDFDPSPAPNGTWTQTRTPAAEYPTGFDSTLAAFYNTPLASPVTSADNLESNNLVGWKPQIRDTGAMFLNRIREVFNNWLLGFRSDGTLFFLPYDYFKAPTASFFSHAGSGISSGLLPTAAAGLSVTVSAGAANVQGTPVSSGGITISGLTDNAVNSLYLTQGGTGVANTTGIPPAGAIGLGTATAITGGIVSVDSSAGSGRQLSTSPIYRNPVEFRVIEPSGNIAQVVSRYTIDQASNRSGLYVDNASVYNTGSKNYLGRYKWQIVEIEGSFTPPQLNAMAYIVFQNSRRRRKRLSIEADLVPALKIGQVFFVEGYGNYRLLDFKGRLVKSNWETAQLTGELVEAGYG